MAKGRSRTWGRIGLRQQASATAMPAVNGSWITRTIGVRETPSGARASDLLDAAVQPAARLTLGQPCGGEALKGCPADAEIESPRPGRESLRTGPAGR